ncbi:MAG: ABC transporter ATP-binding protein [Bacteroidales bacterium]|nr:ABC transporter ATP-binding protein [Bacteroidales bacterium]
MSLNRETYIQLENLSKNFGDIIAVDSLNFSVYKGDIMGFLGPNGAGKSTAIRMMLSLIRPDSGNISLFGTKLNNHNHKILKRIGTLIEEPRFYEYLTASKNLEILSSLSGKKADLKRIYEVLELIGLRERCLSKVCTFSQGMKQRLGIAQAIIHDPELLILDEPANGLDPRGLIDIRNIILRLNQEFGKTILLSSHILKEIELISNRMVIINKGKLVIEGEVSELLHHGDIKVKLETDNNPQAVKLLKSKNITCETDIEGFIKFLQKKIHIPDIVDLLVNNNIKIYSLDAVKTLEDYFLDVT